MYCMNMFLIAYLKKSIVLPKMILIKLEIICWIWLLVWLMLGWGLIGIPGILGLMIGMKPSIIWIWIGLVSIKFLVGPSFKGNILKQLWTYLLNLLTHLKNPNKTQETQDQIVEKQK